MPKSLKVEDFGKHPDEQLANIEMADLVPLPPPYDKIDDQPEWKEISRSRRRTSSATSTVWSACSLPKPKDEAEEEEIVAKFLAACGSSSPRRTTGSSSSL